ncbi:flotillin family protein [Kiloniella litopenaei]|uniref:flotillin family protein n=1 Tax=Kiloniella litopenaei TaxID=1549748 RepID=UPI003BAD1983
MYISNFMSSVIIAGVCVFALLTIGIIFSRLYHRASKEVSFVRTGFGGQKIIMNGGALVFPVLHEIIPVNMNTLRLEVMRSDGQALITRNRMRVDVVAEFYVRVQPTVESIANAAQTLGKRTMMTQELKELVEGKFVDALRSVAAEMSMEELHEKRTDFVQKVQMAVSEDLLKNGLELEAVSLTGLDQTGMEFFNPNNAFDAEGLTRLTEEIEKRKKMRNDIERDTEVQIQNKNLETEKQALEISRDEEYARLEQEREVSIRKAQQAAEIAEEEAIKQQDAEQAQILSKKNIEQSRITADRAVAEERIEMERLLREKEILKERTVETHQIEKVKTLDLAEQDKAIAVAEKSKAQSEAEAEADLARAKSVQAAEQVNTVREREIADRAKVIELIEATKEAEREAIAIKVAAEAGKFAAIDTAEALREEAEGQADQIKIIAQADAESEKLRSEAAAVKYEVDAKGTLAINEAANILSPEQIAMQIKVKLIENLDAIIHESVKPMEQIDSIKVIQVDGLNGSGSGVSGEEGSSGGGALSDQVVNSALKYRAQAPLLDSLLKEVGISGGDINGITQALNGQNDKPTQS